MNEQPKSMEDHLREMGGWVEIEVIRDGKNGPEVIRRERAHNLIVNIGKIRMWKMTIGTSTKMWRFTRLGSGSAAAASGNSNCQTPIASTSRTVDVKTVSTGRTYKWVVSYPSGAGSLSAAAIKEVVLGDQHTTPGGGSILMRTVFTAVAKTTTDKLRITYRARIT